MSRMRSSAGHAWVRSGGGILRELQAIAMERGSHVTRDEYLCRTVELARRGNELPHAKLTPELVRELRASSDTPQRCADKLGLHKRTIEKVRHYETWRHVV